MADFLDREVEVSDAEESDAGDSDGEIPAKKKRKVISSDSSEEDEDDAHAADLPDLINDDVEDDEDGLSESGRKEDSELEQELTDEDLDLIQENLGVKIKRKKRKRVRVVKSDEESGESDKEDAKDVLERELFEGGDEVSEAGERSVHEPVHDELPDLDFSGEDSDVNDFIVDENDKPIFTKKKRPAIHQDHALQEAQEVFGVDFDFDELEQEFGEEEEDDEDQDEYEEDDLIDDEETGERVRKTKKKKKGVSKMSILDVYEPCELERGHLTEEAKMIRETDMPERFQLRSIPVTAPESGELEEEAEWILKNTFQMLPLTQQVLEESTFSRNRDSEAMKKKIHAFLNIMRDQQFEVPFIAFYRKELVEPELNITDLWKVNDADEKWAKLKKSRGQLVKLCKSLQDWQFEQMGFDKPMDENMRALTSEDIERVKGISDLDELNDCHRHILLYYSSELRLMKEKAARERDPGNTETLKQPQRRTNYTFFSAAGLGPFARKFGLTAEQFGENLRDNYQRHDVEQDPATPEQLAEIYLSPRLSTPSEVMSGARFMVAMQIAHEPLVRSCVRAALHERATISCRPTKKGAKLIDEAHPCEPFRYLRNKPVKSLLNDQFLHLHCAKKEGLINYQIMMDQPGTSLQSYLQEIETLFHRDEMSAWVQEWNRERTKALEMALEMMLTEMIKSLEARLLSEASQYVVKECCGKVYQALKVAPYMPENLQDEEDEDWDTARGVRILGICYPDDKNGVSFGAIIDGEGEVTDFLRLKHLLKRRGGRFGHNEREKKEKESDLVKMKEFIMRKKPHVIAVGGMSREALQVQKDFQGVISELEQEQQIPSIAVEIVDDQLSVIYMNSKRAEADFREYPPLLRQAVSIARRLQDPLIEFCQLFNVDEDILALNLHPLQHQLAKEQLLSALNLEFINRVNEVGVDPNRCVSHPHTAPLLQFVCGLGTVKATSLLKILKQTKKQLDNRTLLVTKYHMGPKVFFNCAGFIKIDTNSLIDNGEYIEILDGSRVHPETYEWARKMAIDALEYEETGEPSVALEEIMENPERLRDLDLDAFAEELVRQNYGDKHITLYDIRAELNHRYKDLRQAYRSTTAEDLFPMLTKENPLTFHAGRLITCRVTGFAYRKPQPDQLDQADPVRNKETRQWQCPFCQKPDFKELSEVWSHFDSEQCPGQSVGVKTRLDNGVSGYIPVKLLSDSHVNSPEERVAIGMTVHARITKVYIEKFQVDLSTRSSDLRDNQHKWKPKRDDYYDHGAEDRDKKAEIDKKKATERASYTKRVIAHPAFHNVDYRTCEKLLVDREQGECIIRPSSKGNDRLTVTWKVADGIHQHIDVREEGKENAFSLGKLLRIGDEEYEDLEEIIARHIQPIAAFARDVSGHKNFRALQGDQNKLNKLLSEEKLRMPSKIPYFFSIDRKLAGKILLSYMPSTKPKHEYISITPEGMRYRSQLFTSLNSLISWFKKHFREPIPGQLTPRAGASHTPRTPWARTPLPGGQTPMSTSRTPTGGFTPMSGQTPVGGGSYHNMNTPGTPLTPARTPIHTPSHTPSRPPPGFNNPTPSSVQDWAAAAQSWMRQKPRASPRTGTPLYDE